MPDDLERHTQCQAQPDLRELGCWDVLSELLEAGDVYADLYSSFTKTRATTDG